MNFFENIRVHFAFFTTKRALGRVVSRTNREHSWTGCEEFDGYAKDFDEAADEIMSGDTEVGKRLVWSLFEKVAGRYETIPRGFETMDHLNCFVAVKNALRSFIVAMPQNEKSETIV